MTFVLLILKQALASKWARRAGVVVAVMATVLLTYRTGLSRGSKRTHAEDVERERAAVAAADMKYRAMEATNEKRIEDLRVAYVQQRATELAVDRRAADDLAVGAQRVRVAVTRCSPNTTTSGPAPARTDAVETAELAPEVAATLYTIAADCDSTTRQLTALQTWAVAAVKLCNGGKSP